MFSNLFNKNSHAFIIWAGGVFLLLLMTNCSNEGNTLNGKQKKIIHIEEKWFLQPPNFDSLQLGAKTVYNEKGKPVEESQYSSTDGSLIILTKWTYDEHFNITSKITDNKEVNKIFTENYTYKYDRKGRKISMLEKNSEIPYEMEHIYVHHSNGNYTDTTKINSKLMSVIEFNKDDKVLSGKNFEQQMEIINELDEHGNYTLRRNIYASGPGNEVAYTNDYDSLGNLIRRTIDPQHYREYEYNENGDVVKETRLDTGNPRLIIISKYQYFE